MKRWILGMVMVSALSSAGCSDTGKGSPVSEPLTIEVRTITPEGMLLDAAAKTRKALADLGKVDRPVTIHYRDTQGETGLFSLTWNAEQANRTDWDSLDDWTVLNEAETGRFLTVQGSRPIASFCGNGIETGMFGPAGTNPGYFEGFCRLMTSNSLPWAQVDGR